MKHPILFFISILLLLGCTSHKDDSAAGYSFTQEIISQDITHFWEAYDAIQTTSDSLEQITYLQDLFLDKASVGQQRMIQARNYKPAEYLASIQSSPKFWNSIRKNTENLEIFNQELTEGVEKLAKVYPTLKPATIYYTLGTHRSPGTGVDSLVLIGTEFALGDTTTVSTELKEHLQNYYTLNPIDHLQFLIVHEYVHTQQKPMVHSLLPLALYEGIPDFVAQIATERRSPFKAFRYGPANEAKIKERFERDMFDQHSVYSWLWNSSNNEFQTRDLGYYIGYKIAAIYHEQSSDKALAIKTLIELDYTDETQVEKLVNSTGFFSKSVNELAVEFEAQRPSVKRIEQFPNKSQDVDPEISQLTVTFSEPMSENGRGFEFGPLGKDQSLQVEEVIGFSEDGLSFTFGVKLAPNKQFQLILSDRFFSKDGFPLKPYLIDFKTK